MSYLYQIIFLWKKEKDINANDFLRYGDIKNFTYTLGIHKHELIKYVIYTLVFRKFFFTQA